MSNFLPKRFQVIHNPTAGRRKLSRIRDITARLRRNGREVAITPTTGPGHAIDLARAAAVANSADVIVAAGGDGTISECATGLMQALDDGVSAEALPPLGILPMGTANVLAMDLGLVTMGGVARRKIVRTLMGGQVRALQLGIAENSMEKRAFVMMVGAGFDGATVGAIDPVTKRRWGKLAYVRAGIESLIAGPGEGAQLLDGDQRLASSAWVIVSNGQHYAGGYRLTRRTNLTRNTLAALAVKGCSRLALARANTSLGLRIFDRPFNSEAMTGARFRIESGERDCMVQVDGDYFGLAPVDISIAREPIKFMVPNHAGLTKM